MKLQAKLSRIAIAVALSAGLAGTAMAQETASAMEGKVSTPTGAPAAGTKVTVIHVPSGTSRQVTVNENGLFNLRGLRVGGPYRIIVDSTDFQDTTLDDVYLQLGVPFPLSVQLEAPSDVEVISVTGSSLAATNFGATGPQSVFDIDDLQNMPAINRSITDIVRADPRVFVDEGGNDSISCGGNSPRFNSLTLDGVRLNDAFGLNSNGYPTERMPFSYDAIAQVAVELAPFDVQYGGFTACNINAVTKSGTNEIHGGVFFDYTSDSFRGDKSGDTEVDNGNYTEKRYGFNVGLPLIADKLFLFTAYEKLEGAQLFNYNAFTNGNVTQDDINRVTEIAQRVYNYEVGGMPASMPIEDEKILIKLDWNINDQHRANLVYNWNDGFSISQSDGGSRNLSLANHFYERGAELQNIVTSVFSDWTDAFSTELRVGYTKLDNRQNSLDAASGFAESQIQTARGTIFIGPDDSRQSNDLNYDVFNFKLAGVYYAGDHKITGGIEYEGLDVFNLFMQHTVGEYRFSSIENFEAGLPFHIEYNNAAGTNNPNDAAASFSYGVTTLYAQDEFYLSDELKVMFGLRYERYSSDDTPRNNLNFQQRYGYPNTRNVDGIDLLQPRFGFTYTYSEDLEFRGGIGLYSGGNPNVWISNAYSNDGVTNINVRERNLTGWQREVTSLFDLPLSGQGRPLYDIPQQMVDIVANTSTVTGDGNTNATDPDFEIPSEWKYAFGATYIAPMDYVITADVIYTRRQDSAIVRDANLVDSGQTLFDGRPIYVPRDPSRPAGSDFVLSNVTQGDGESLIFSLGVTKDWENGLDASFSYAYVDAEDANPMTSSVAFSNYVNFAALDRNNPAAATSDYAVGHRFNFALGYTAEFVDGYKTRFNLFATANEGRPFSYVFNDNTGSAFPWHFRDSRQLLYVPTLNDANVVFADAATEAAFNDWVDSEGLTRGAIVGRNTQSADWWFKADLRISQELPGFYEGHRAQAFIVVENLTNLLNSDWGDYREGTFGGDEVVRVARNAEGQYVYSNFGNPEQNLDIGPSLWEVRFGINYNF